MSKSHYAIQMVVRRTGLSAHVIRIWEKRYGAVEPVRTSTNRRLYSEAEIEKLILLRAATHAGHSIGNIAKLPVGKLRKLAHEKAEVKKTARPASPKKPKAENFVADGIAAVKALNFGELEATLKQAEMTLGNLGLLQQVIAPLAKTIGELWRSGEITSAHEHFASGVMRVFLGHAAKPFAGSENSPVLIVATPPGQLHELGALIAAAAAVNAGWQVMYLGASLPSAEIAGVARLKAAAAVALSIVYPEDDARIPVELMRLRELLPAGMPILIGGRAAAAYRAAVEKIGAIEIRELKQFGNALDGFRRPSAKKPKAPKKF